MNKVPAFPGKTDSKPVSEPPSAGDKLSNDQTITQVYFCSKINAVL